MKRREIPIGYTNTPNKSLPRFDVHYEKRDSFGGKRRFRGGISKHCLLWNFQQVKLTYDRENPFLNSLYHNMSK